MNTNTHPSKLNIKLLASVGAFAALSFSTLAFQDANYKTSIEPVVLNQPSQTRVQSVTMTDNTTGRAVIYFDGFRMEITSFEVAAYPDSNGVPGSEFTAVEVIELGEIKIFDANGNPYKDFTDYQDHRDINALLAGYIMQHDLVEVI